MALAIMGATAACQTVYEAHFVQPNNLKRLNELKDKPFLKCHMRSGNVVVLEAWTVDDVANTIRGYGIEYGRDRELVGQAEARVVPLADVALLETNRPYEVQVATGSVIALAIATGVSLAVTAVCLSNS